MDSYNSIKATSKYKHLSFEHYEHIVREITKHDAFHNGKKRNTGRTALIQSLASDVGTSVSNVYSIINDASISIQNSDLTLRTELSATAVFHKRSRVHKISNMSKLQKAHDFIQLIVNVVKNNTLSSIGETVNSLMLHCPDKIAGRPYHSCDRASNENCNGLIRRFNKKGTDMNTVSKTISTSINEQINNKKRRILHYSSAEDAFLNELSNLGLTNVLCFYA